MAVPLQDLHIFDKRSIVQLKVIYAIIQITYYHYTGSSSDSDGNYVNEANYTI